MRRNINSSTLVIIYLLMTMCTLTLSCEKISPERQTIDLVSPDTGETAQLKCYYYPAVRVLRFESSSDLGVLDVNLYASTTLPPIIYDLSIDTGKKIKDISMVNLSVDDVSSSQSFVVDIVNGDTVMYRGKCPGRSSLTSDSKASMNWLFNNKKGNAL